MLRRTITSLLVALFLLSGTGCNKWRVPKLDLNQFRDPRAVDIDSRLADPLPDNSR